MTVRVRVKYQAFRRNGVDLTGKVAMLSPEAAAPLLQSNIVIPWPLGSERTAVETAALAIPENEMQPPGGRKDVSETDDGTDG